MRAMADVTDSQSIDFFRSVETKIYNLYEALVWSYAQRELKGNAAALNRTMRSVQKLRIAAIGVRSRRMAV